MNHVLVVDDDIGMRCALAAMFEDRGWSTETASDPREALKALQRRPPQLMVSDVCMPEGGGIRLMREVRAVSPGTAVVMMTGFGGIPEAVEAMKDGACDYLTKPVSVEQIERAVDRLLHRTPPLAETQSRPLREMERELFESTLRVTCGNRSRAAKLLGVSLRTVRNKVKEFGLPSRGEYAITRITHAASAGTIS